MHAIRANSPQSMVARLIAKHTHCNRKPPQTKPEMRRRKSDRREYRDEIKLCLWPCFHSGVEL